MGDYYPNCQRCDWVIPRNALVCTECGFIVHDDCPCDCPVQLQRFADTEQLIVAEPYKAYAY
jgi:hypothetical protein